MRLKKRFIKEKKKKKKKGRVKKKKEGIGQKYQLPFRVVMVLFCVWVVFFFPSRKFPKSIYLQTIQISIPDFLKLQG